MEVVDRWTGRRAAALRAALRMTNEAFAEHLGAGVRTVANWEAKPDLVVSAAMQEVLDAALDQAADSAKRRFALLFETAGSEHPRSGARLRGMSGPGSLAGLPAADDDPPSLVQSSDQPSPRAVVQASQDAWRQVRQYLTESGPQLADQATHLYDEQFRVAGVPTLAPAEWIPDVPIPLDMIALSWAPVPPLPHITGVEAEATATLPLRAPGHAFPRYTSAIRYVSPPVLFENRHSYRLLDVRWGDGFGELTFGLSTFFDKLDVSEALCHETASAAMRGQLTWSSLPLRALVGDPFDLAARNVNPGVTTLTIRRDMARGTGTFFLLRRDPTQVTGARHYSLIPAGEFQPASISAESVATDLDLWRNMVREYSEEMLGQPEHDGSGGNPVDYETWSFFRDMNHARDAGQLRAYALGVVVDALSLNAVIATAVVIDDHCFDRIFRDLVSRNPEGDVVMSIDGKQAIRGLPFDEATVARFVEREPLGQTSAACLSLAWDQRDSLLPSARIASTATSGAARPAGNGSGNELAAKRRG